MLLFCGFVLQNPYYNLKTLSVGGLLMSGQVYFILGCGGTPEKGTPGSMPFFEKLSRYTNSYSGPGFD